MASGRNEVVMRMQPRKNPIKYACALKHITCAMRYCTHTFAQSERKGIR